MEENKEAQALIGVSNALARASDGMSMTEKKMCCIFLAKIKFTQTENPKEIWVDKAEIIEQLGSKIDNNHQSVYLRKLAQDMVHHSDLRFTGQDKDEWMDMPLFTKRKSSHGRLMIEVYEDAMKLLEGLEDNYITLFLADIIKFTSDETGKRAYKLYEFLRLNSDTRRICQRTLSTCELKELFDIPKDGKGSYMRDSGGFDRTNFEKYVLDPVIKQVARCEHVVLHKHGDALYSKVKKGNRVIGYKVEYAINKYAKKIHKESFVEMEQDPKVMKVAQDLINAENKIVSRSKAKQRQWDDINKNDVDYDAIAAKKIHEQMTSSKME